MVKLFFWIYGAIAVSCLFLLGVFLHRNIGWDRNIAWGIFLLAFVMTYFISYLAAFVIDALFSSIDDKREQAKFEKK